MKKILVFVLVAVLIFALGIPAFASGMLDTGDIKENNTTVNQIVMRVSALKKDNTTQLIGEYTSFEDGWNNAMKNATSKQLANNGYIAIEVDLLADWTAKNGEFSEDDGDGFDWGTIIVPEKATVVLNLNGHTIDRGLTEWENNGEVIYIDEEANVIINGGADENDTTTGTITGGYSAQNGGGIHLKDNANLTLNYVNVDKNHVEDASGAGIFVDKGATLKMKGGSISDNVFAWTYSLVWINDDNKGVAIYAHENATVELDDVDICNNYAGYGKYAPEGTAIFAEKNCNVTINNCYIANNGKEVAEGLSGRTLISNESNGTFVIKNCIIKNNGELYYNDESTAGNMQTKLIRIYGSLEIEDCVISENNVGVVLSITKSVLNMKGTKIIDNHANVLSFTISEGKGNSVISGCEFNNNVLEVKEPWNETSFHFDSVKNKGDLIFTADNNFGDSTFKNKDYVTFESAQEVEPARFGSIFGDGSVAIIISFVSLLVSACTLTVIIVDRKRKQK